jgi:hypothetical protein
MITKLRFILIIFICIQRGLFPRSNSGASSLAPETGRITPRGNYPQVKNHYGRACGQLGITQTVQQVSFALIVQQD